MSPEISRIPPFPSNILLIRPSITGGRRVPITIIKPNEIQKPRATPKYRRDNPKVKFANP